MAWLFLIALVFSMIDCKWKRNRQLGEERNLSEFRVEEKEGDKAAVIPKEINFIKKKTKALYLYHGKASLWA